MKKILFVIKKFLPRSVINFYHYLVSLFFALWYGNPSKKIVVIGITGTKGKTTSACLAHFLFQKLGFKTALSSSDFFYYGEEKEENKTRITMPGRGYLQKFLKEAVIRNCELAIIECTSEGLWQNRHAFIDFDIAVFLGIHPEHIEHHGGYENYRNSKGKLFKSIDKSFFKKRKGRNIKYLRGVEVKKTIIVNTDDFEADYFLNFHAEQKITYSLESNTDDLKNHLKPTSFKATSKGVDFVIEGKKFSASLLGKVNLYNILAVFSLFKALGISLNSLAEPLKDFKSLPGRMDVIPAKGFKVIIDYAHTPISIEELYQTIISLFKPQRLLCLIGSAGGVRDKWKRPVIGEISAKYCNYIVISNEDPMGEDPVNIIRAIEMGAKKYLGEFGVEKPIEMIPDRKEAIFRLVEIAQKGDVIVSIGKGSENSIDFGEEKISWNEKETFLKALKEYKKNYGRISTKTSE